MAARAFRERRTDSGPPSYPNKKGWVSILYGPSTKVAHGHSKQTLRFHLPADVAALYALRKLPRLASRLPERAKHNKLMREANRIGHKLDLLIRGGWSPNGESLAHWLGLPEPAKRKSSRKPRSLKGSLWSDLVQSYSN